jgi:hypothetical protein
VTFVTRSGLYRCLAVLAACAVTPAPVPRAAGRAGSPAPRAAQPPPAADKTVLAKYCVGCHNGRTRTAGLDLAGLDIEHPAARAEIWEKVVRKLRTGSMPPSGMPRPDDAAYDALASALERELDAATPRRAATPALHRLNRTEYANAVRDLLALEVDASTLLPPDDISGGFDNNAGALGVSPALLERYLSAAAKIAALAVGDSALLGPSAQTYVVRGDASQTTHVEGLPLGTRGGVVARHMFPLDGQYVLKASLLQTNLGAVRGLLEPHDLEFSIDGQRVFLATVGGDEDNARSAANAADIITALDSRLTTRIAVTAGPHDVGAAFLARSAAQGGSKLQPFLRTTLDSGDHTGLPHVASLTITGPYDATGPGETPSRHRVFSCRPRTGSDELRCARTILSTLAYRAYRRPVSNADVERLLSLYRTGREQRSFDTGIEFGLRTILANPKFVFRAEGRAPQSGVDDFDLASRLSFFLWSSIPDDELLAAAERHQLHAGPTLEREVRRMLADPRADAIVTNFAAQWLQLRNLRSTAPDKEEFPDFDDNLRQSFLRETELLVGSVIHEDRSALELLTADYTFVDERLAKHYGIPGVYGSHFRRVALPGPERRGLLGQGSILTVTSHANRTSPVVRGKWILENLLGTPPPPPPPNVPPLDEGEGVAPKTMRERMEQHRRNPACAGCHTIMDPIGLALENFDAVGAWRTVDAGTTIDATGQLTDGTHLEGPVSLREALLKRRDVVVGNLTEKLLAYALGRNLDYSDMPDVRRIVRRAGDEQYRWSSIVRGVVTSPSFLGGAPDSQVASKGGH